MATQGYDPNKAATFNQLRQQGLSEDAAADQAGISNAPSGTYVYGDNGQLGAPVGFGAGKVAGVDYVKPTAAQTAESARFDQGLQSSSNFEQVDYAVKAKNPPSLVTPINYVTTSTETVSGGGSTAIIAGAKNPTEQSQAYATEAAAKQREINQFYRDNPGNFERKRAGLPPLTPEENEARSAKLGTLQNQYNTITDKQAASETPGTPTTITTPNTTTTTQTVTSGTTAVNTPVQAPAGDDTAINQQTEIQIGTTLSNPLRGTTASPLPPDGDEALAATQAAQDAADLTIAAESANPVSPLDTGYVSDAEQIAQANADAAFNARLDRAAEVDLANSGDEAAEAAARAREAADLRIAAESATPLPVDNTDGVADLFAPPPTKSPANVPPSQAGPIGVAYDDDGNLMPGYSLTEDGDPVYVGGDFVEPATAASAEASRTAAATTRAQNQSTLAARLNQPSAADWRVRLSLAPNSKYLYNIPVDPKVKNSGPGILAPLAATDGVIFPYTPSIETSYQAKYDSYDLVHSNYRGYFYKNSMVENISIKGTFTAQDTKEAQYLLAVIHFFRSVTKMFYGQDAEAGAPPPLVYLSGFGQYQFNKHPCVVSNFGYSLPNDIDYIRADGFNNIGLNMENRRNQSSGPAPGGSLGTVVAMIGRLSTSGLSVGGLSNRPNGQSAVNQNVTNQNVVNSTYVPTKMEISLTLLPMQTRNQVSKQFSLKSFANGALLQQGFW